VSDAWTSGRTGPGPEPRARLPSRRSRRPRCRHRPPLPHPACLPLPKPPSTSSPMLEISDRSVRRHVAQLLPLCRCPNAVAALSTPANAVSRTPVRPQVRIQTCTLVRPVEASTRRSHGRHGHEQARAADRAHQRRRGDVAGLPHPSDPGQPLRRRRTCPPKPSTKEPSTSQAPDAIDSEPARRETSSVQRRTPEAAPRPPRLPE
jgi:hypothetical protein